MIENRKTRPERFSVRCSYEEKEAINKLSKLMCKNRNQVIIDLIKLKLEELKENE